MKKESVNFENQKNQASQLNFNKFKLNITQKIIITILYLLLVFIYVIFANPLLNLHFAAGIFNVSIFVLILGLIWHNNIQHIVGIGILITLVIFVIAILSSPIIRSNDYYNLLGDVQTKDYEKDKPEIDESMVPVVDQDLAEKLGDKVLGNDLGLGSQYTVGEYYFVKTADDLAWVAPLEPQSFFKWFQHRDGAPGYVYVSATNPNDVKLVKDIDGKDLKIKYTNNSYFFSRIKRHAYLNKNMTRAMTDFSFEIDDSGNPYWVITSYVPTIGFSGYDTEGVIVVDAQSGETKYYNDINKLPDWIERVQPKQIVQEQVNDWGAYKNGWLNTILAQNEMIQTTDGYGYVYIDNEPYYYSGLTSIKSDQSTVGFMLVNTRTKASTFYKINGATEDAAQKSAQGQVQQYEYTASFPILLNIQNTPTYFMTLKDQDGLIKQYAYVSVKNYNIVGVGNTRTSAENAYYQSLKDNGAIKASDNVKDQTKLTGEIERINKVDNSYYLKLKDNDLLFSLEDDISMYLPLTQVGDKVELEYTKSDSDYQIVSSFKNSTLEK